MQQEDGAVGSWSKPQEIPGMGETWLQRDPLPAHQGKRGLFPALPVHTHQLLLLHRGMMDGETQEWDFSGAALVLPAGFTPSLLNEPQRV